MEVERDGSVCRLTLTGGALDAASARDLTATATELREDRHIRVVVVTSQTAPFCSGPAADLDAASFDPDPAAALAALRPPVVAVVSGHCLSVGLEIALAADIRVCGNDATFGFPDLAHGRLPSWGGTQRLSRAIRPAEAAAMLLLGREVPAAKAASLGLVHTMDADPEALAASIAEELVSRGPLALELAKEAVHRGAELPLRDGLRLEGDLNHQLAATDDRAEGLAAFFDKRPPDFAGR